MRTGIGATAAFVAGALVLGVVVLCADTLVMRDGRRIEGQLVSVQRGVIEFQEQGDFRGPRTIQVRREDVQRIEMDEPRGGPDRRGGVPDRQEMDRPDQVQGREGRPSGLREKEVWVSATDAWKDSGIEVRDGQVVYFTTHGGDIQWRRGEHTRAGGNPGAPYNARRPIPGRAIGALIGKIGAGSNDYFFIGDNEGPVRVRGGGRLFLGINDENLADNQGAYRVTVYY
jgi:hypothetical protein